MFCPSCGKEIPNESKFCLACGKAIVVFARDAPEVPPPSEPRAEAERIMADEHEGAASGQTTQVSVPSPALKAPSVGTGTRPKATHRWKTLALILLGVISASVTGYLLWTSMANELKRANEHEAEQTRLEAERMKDPAYAEAVARRKEAVEWVQKKAKEYSPQASSVGEAKSGRMSTSSSLADGQKVIVAEPCGCTPRAGDFSLLAAALLNQDRAALSSLVDQGKVLLLDGGTRGEVLATNLSGGRTHIYIESGERKGEGEEGPQG